MYDAILVPTDGSDNARLATRKAIAIAARFDATLHALFVVERSRDDPAQTGYEEHVKSQLNEGRDLVETIEQRAKEEGVETVSAVERGVARTKIEAYAADHDVDAIVIGSTGASGTAEKFLGTVSKYVVNEAPADVLVVRPDDVLE